MLTKYFYDFRGVFNRKAILIQFGYLSEDAMSIDFLDYPSKWKNMGGILSIRVLSIHGLV